MGRRMSKMARTRGSPDRFNNTTNLQIAHPMQFSMTGSQLKQLQSKGDYSQALDLNLRPQTCSSIQNKGLMDQEGSANNLNTHSSLGRNKISSGGKNQILT